MNEKRNINNIYDFSNVIVDTNLITYFVKFFDDCYNRLVKTEQLELEKNEKLKYEYQNYNYKRNYAMEFVVKLIEKSNEYTTVEINTLDSYNEHVNAGRFNNVKSVRIILNLTFDRSSGVGNYETHENSFEISLKPYEITLTRKSNYNDEGMDEIEKTIVDAFNGYTKVNTIFCTK